MARQQKWWSNGSASQSTWLCLPLGIIAPSDATEQFASLVILNKRSLCGEGSGRAARSVAACPERAVAAEGFFATHQARVWPPSLSELHRVAGQILELD